MLQIFSLVILILALITFTILSVVIVYHLWKYSFRKQKAELLIAIYTAVAIVLFVLTIIAYFQISWRNINQSGTLNL